MVQNSKFTIQLLEKIGTPLAAAIESVPLSGEDQEVQSAKIMAQMLGQAVQISISLNALFNIVEEEAQADSTRLALAALAAPLLADFYRHNERVPEDQDIKRLVKSLESVVAFADNFSAAEEGKSRLSTLDHDAPLFDKTQSALVVMQVLVPVMTAVSEFSFGQSEPKLMQNITSKLEKMAADIAKNAKLSDKLSELMILKALAALYAECHRSETQRLASATSEKDEALGELSLDPVWEAFGTRTAMVEVIVGIKSNDVAAASTVAPTPVVPVTPAPEQSEPAAAAPAASSSSPMGFFKTPDAAATTPETSAPVPGTTSEVAAPPPAPAVEPVAPVIPTAEAPADTPPSSPMGFFKPGAKKTEDDAS
jgi:hypothetical protein